MAGKTVLALVLATALAIASVAWAEVRIESFSVLPGSHPHDVAPAADGGVWYTAQHRGALGWLDPRSAETVEIPLGPDPRPHGVIVGPDGTAWVTDSGLNAIVAVNPKNRAVNTYPLPEDSGYANLNTATFDGRGVLWFTGQSGIYGSLDPTTGAMRVFAAPGGRGPYGIATTPAGNVYYASLAGSHIARIDSESGNARVIEPPTPGQGARRVWADSHGRVWVAEWNAGQLSRLDPTNGTWKTWPLPGSGPRAYAVYVDEADKVWVTDFGANATLRLDSRTETFEAFPSPRAGAAARQLLSRKGEVWAPESRTDTLVVYRYE